MRFLLQAVFTLAVLLFGSGSVSAMLCEDKAAQEHTKTSELPDVASERALAEQPRRLRCELDSGVECDLPSPAGEPQVPQSQGPQRPRSTLLVVAHSARSLGDHEIPHDLQRGHILPGFTSEVFRPPKNT